MRVLHITESRGWSGGTVQLWNLCRGLRQAGQAVAVFCPPDGELPKRLEGMGVLVTTGRLREDYDLMAAWQVAKLCRRFRPDIVHAHHPRAHAIALLASLLGPVPTLIVSRRVSFRLKKWNLFSQLKYRAPQIRKFVAVSQDIGRVLVAGGVSPDKVEVIHSGVDVQKFTPRPSDESLRKKLGLPTGIPIVANLTHYSWWKGQAYFLEAAHKLLASGVKAHFLLAGKDTDGPEAKGQVQKWGLEGKVSLAGFQTDIPGILSLVNVSVVSSLAGEGFSGVLRESMCMGVPVVATDVGGNAELVQPEQTGLLVAAANADALAQAIGRLIQDTSLAKACAQRAQENVRTNYSLESMIQKTMALYQKLVA